MIGKFEKNTWEPAPWTHIQYFDTRTQLAELSKVGSCAPPLETNGISFFYENTVEKEIGNKTPQS